jgi:hypothetical protein
VWVGNAAELDRASVEARRMGNGQRGDCLDESHQVIGRE